MARYIDADALLENLKRQYGEELGWWCTVNMSDVGMMIEDAPTVNVAPIADTVKKMLEMMAKHKCTPYPSDMWVVPWFRIEEIAKEILEGTK